MRYRSTRGGAGVESAASAVVKGIADDGGLFVPDGLPKVPLGMISSMKGMGYAERAYVVMRPFLDELNERELMGCIDRAYSGDAFGGDPAPLSILGDGLAVLELWHGPTCAFKDMALQFLPPLMGVCKGKIGTAVRTLILTATSGDTGKAALEGFRDAEGMEVAVFYPSEGVSAVQRLQMQTQEGSNVHVFGVEGNFDDAQRGVKEIFSDGGIAAEAAAEGWALSSANSINWGRLLPQIAYYFSAYADLLRLGRMGAGDPMNVCVPTGNFGNILAAWYARAMGLPIGRLTCASNMNDVLTEFFATGAYESGRAFHRTMSPSMDILVSSNLERLLYEAAGRDGAAVGSLMKALAEEGRYDASALAAAGAFGPMDAGSADEAETAAAIKGVYDRYGYVMDPHTAVGYAVLGKIAERREADRPDRVGHELLVSTASPLKFAESVHSAIFGPTGAALGWGDLDYVDGLSEGCSIGVPAQFGRLRHAKALHGEVIPKGGMADAVRSIMKGSVRAAR
ncbi:MAG: threonine synthase [Oscillospiraceae bacterium]|nr:threonine synthase [Oscillospiraceae bacterium]